METLTELVLNTEYAGMIITPSIITRLAGGSHARRWGLVNRALQSDEFIHLKRGMYLLSPALSRMEISSLSIANRLAPESYVTMESALAYFGWLQEEPMLVQSCIVRGRERTFRNALGSFEYTRIPVADSDFYKCVLRETLPNGYALVASPERAIGDLVYDRRLKWEGILGLCAALRTDVSNLSEINTDDLREISLIYRSAKARNFLSRCASALDGGS
ncbi:MAG: hypothetical protein GQ565_08120 [Candidatus Aegiribacteria sp.]|nr:hypothetical protein [Candidatus Aegiribacteria sp.]